MRFHKEEEVASKFCAETEANICQQNIIAEKYVVSNSILLICINEFESKRGKFQGLCKLEAFHKYQIRLIRCYRNLSGDKMPLILISLLMWRLIDNLLSFI